MPTIRKGEIIGKMFGIPRIQVEIFQINSHPLEKCVYAMDDDDDPPNYLYRLT